MRAHKRADSEPITADTFAQLYALLEREYPGKVWRVAEVCPVAVVKTIDNEADARATIANIELAKGPLAAGVASPPPQTPKCADCGAVMNEGEAKCFTCCDACWRKTYPAPSSPPAGWQNIESAPKDGTEIVLCWNDGITAPMYRVGFNLGSGRCWQSTHGYLHNEQSWPTLWMPILPLPLPPARPMSKPDYDTSLARMAGNIAAGLAVSLPDPQLSPASFVEAIVRVSKSSVCLARAIIVEVKRTEPEKLGVDALSSRTPEQEKP